MHYFVRLILIGNGLYDLLCACSILFLLDVPVVGFLSTLHTTMFSNTKNPIAFRILAYWLATYGIVRLAAGYDKDTSLTRVAAMTYFIEAICWEYECMVGKSMMQIETSFVSVTSVILGVVVLT